MNARQHVCLCFKISLSKIPSAESMNISTSDNMVNI